MKAAQSRARSNAQFPPMRRWQRAARSLGAFRGGRTIASFILSHLSDQFIYPSKTSEICFRARAVRIGNVRLLLATGEPGKDENLVIETGEATDQFGDLP